jgi:pimeloyl-ACP methyl ester carboxylesterase
MTNSDTERTPQERTVDTPGGAVFVRDTAGSEPALVMMHGFPDDSVIYRRVVPLLAPYRTVTFDWLGYGRSGRPDTADLDHGRQIDAVLDALDLHRVVLVGHDASGPDAVDYAIDQRGRVAQVVLLNTYYGHAPELALPDLIQLLADEKLVGLANALLDDPVQRLWLLQLTAREFGGDPDDPESVGIASILPQFFGDAGGPDAQVAIRAWTADMSRAMDGQDARVTRGELATLDLPVDLIFGARDPFLGPAVAAHLASLFLHAEVHLVDGASHWPQWDDPSASAQLIRRSLVMNRDRP